MPNISSNRELPVTEITKLLTEKTATQRDGHLAQVVKWPGEANLKLLAQAVVNRNKFVVLNNKKFSIRYDSKYEAVFIKPADPRDGFVPCGYISFRRLKDALTEVSE
jgi:hypothetical protein